MTNPFSAIQQICRKVCYILPLLLGIIGCSKLSSIDTSSDTCITNYDTSVNFSDYRTFLLRDTVARISSMKSESVPPSDSSLVASIVPAIAAELLQRGYSQTDSLSDADFAINVALANVDAKSIEDIASLSQNHHLDSYLEWYSGGSPIWGNFSGFWYPWTYEEFETTNGVLLIEFVSTQSIRNLRKDSTASLQFLWQAIITGVITEDRYLPDKGSDYIQEAFNQSEYLLKNEME